MLSIDASTCTTINSDLLCTSLNCITLKVLVNRFASWSIMYEITNYIKQSGIYVSVEVFKTTCHKTYTYRFYNDKSTHRQSDAPHNALVRDLSVYWTPMVSFFTLFLFYHQKLRVQNSIFKFTCKVDKIYDIYLKTFQLARDSSDANVFLYLLGRPIYKEINERLLIYIVA